MQQIAVISGKGGTGKTSLTSAFASLTQSKVMADCDVDAANLYLTLQPDDYREEVFPGASKAVIEQSKCIDCGLCEKVCRFDAVSYQDGQVVISEFACDGCELCMHVCPTKAITMVQSMDSRWYVGTTRFGPLVHARLGVAEDLSGKLVTVVREEAKKIAKEKGLAYIIIDGPPGIGCPVIASVTGTDKVVVVTEPTQSGLSDLKRVVQMVRGFRIEPMVIINKFDLNERVARQIENVCLEDNLNLIGKIPFNKIMVDALIQQQTIIEYAPIRMWLYILKIFGIK